MLSDQEQMMIRRSLLADLRGLSLRGGELDKVLTEACQLVGKALSTDLNEVSEIEKGEEGECLLIPAGIVGWQPGVVGEVRLPSGTRFEMSVGRYRNWWARALVGAGMALSALFTPAHAQSGAAGKLESEHYRGENGSDGDKPIAVTFNYASDLNASVSGGQSRGVVYLGRASVLLDAELDKLVGLHDTTAHLSFYQIHGIGLSGRHVSNLLLVSGLEAEPAIRLNQVWVQVAPSATTSLRFGKFTAAQEFMSSKTASLFVNSTFGWPGSFATDLPSGGPSYPLAAPGARLSVRPNDRTTLRVATFAGDSAGPGGGDPQRREKHGFNTFGFAGRPFVIGEVSRSIGGESPALTVTLGGWLHFDHVANVGDPTAISGPIVGTPGRGVNFGGYGMVDKRIWRSATIKKRTANAFVRVSYSPSDRNVIDIYADGGITLAVPFRGRDGDTVGLAVGIAHISPRLRSTGEILLRLIAPSAVPPAFEGVAEVSYQATLVGPLKVQPNVQYIVHPASSALSIQTPEGRVPNALVLGLRSFVSF